MNPHNYAFNVTSRHSLVTRGYLDTPSGRSFSNVVQDIRFGNQQQIVNSDTEYEQRITQTSTARQRSFGRPHGGPASATTNRSFSLDMDIKVQVAPDGSETQATTVAQNY